MSAASSTSILIVDDDEDIREVLTDVLTERGYRAITAANGAEALEPLKTVRLSLILLDLNMPVMDGFEFRRMQRSDPVAARIPTVVMSALQHMRERIVDLAVDDALEKPLILEHLLQVIERYCGSSPRRPGV
jgi:CheY-like chemotaxis protein